MVVVWMIVYVRVDFRKRYRIGVGVGCMESSDWFYGWSRGWTMWTISNELEEMNLFELEMKLPRQNKSISTS